MMTSDGKITNTVNERTEPPPLVCLKGCRLSDNKSSENSEVGGKVFFLLIHVWVGNVFVEQIEC